MKSYMDTQSLKCSGTIFSLAAQANALRDVRSLYKPGDCAKQV